MRMDHICWISTKCAGHVPVSKRRARRTCTTNVIELSVIGAPR